jgi:hypothetical protein
MPFYVVRRTWDGAPSTCASTEAVRLIADCPSTGEAEGLAEVEASGHTFAGRDPDAGGWWAADSGTVHRIEVAETWPPEPSNGVDRA